jgi:alpha-L-rhamnosidase
MRWTTRAAGVGDGLASALKEFDLEGGMWGEGAGAERVSGLIVGDFERIVSGTVRLTLDAPAGTVVVGALVEVPSPAALSSAQTFTYTARGADDVFETQDPCGGRYAVLIDWSSVQVTGTSAALNALWARGLADFAAMSEWLGDAGRARWARGLRDGVRAGFEVFWDPERGVYRDHAVDGKVRAAVSEHTAAAAVCAGLVPEDRHALIRDFLLDRDAMLTRSPVQAHGSDVDGAPTAAVLFAPPEPDWDVQGQVVGAQPFFRHVVHDALALLGAADRIAGLCRDWERLLAIGPSAFRETWEGGSFCHGWSATPSRDLVAYALGVTPGAPGCERVRVAPRLGELDWAEGVVPTPHGPVHVRAERNGVYVEGPVPVDIDLPGQETKSLGPGKHDIHR